jgi:hypothetical protein
MIIVLHDRNIIVAYFHARYGNNEVQFPLHYLYTDWKEEYKNKLVKEKEDTEKSRENFRKQRDLDDIKRLKKLHPEKFI